MNNNYYQPTAATVDVSSIPNIEALRQSMLSALKPMLKAPLTAVLCENQQLVITQYNGALQISGYVHSQNSYGAMISTDFSLTAVESNGFWNIYNVKLGVKNATAYAKNFTKNWVALMGLCAGAGLLMFLLITLII